MKGQLNHLPTSDFIESNPMSYDGSCSWDLDEDGEKKLTIFFEYQRTFGTLYVNLIEYSGEQVSDDVVKEAVLNELGTCQFDDTEIVRI